MLQVNAAGAPCLLSYRPSLLEVLSCTLNAPAGQAWHFTCIEQERFAFSEGHNTDTVHVLAGSVVLSMDMYNDATRLIDGNFDGELCNFMFAVHLQLLSTVRCQTDSLQINTALLACANM